MDATQFNTVLQLLAQLATQNDRLHQEMVAGFDAARNNLEKGLANQEAISQEILRAVGGPFEVLENEVHQIKRNHSRRLTKLERKTGLA